MTNEQNHIVNTCKWITSFDREEKSHELQNSLSHWSAFGLGKVLNEILDQFSLSDMNLRIDKLELDLGTIEYDLLLEELPQRIRMKLKEQLTDLIFNSSNPSVQLEQVEGSKSDLDVLRKYLLSGLFPWHHQEVKDLDSLVEEQLRENFEQFLDVIQSLGRKEAPRKRIAWQFKEQHIEKVLTGLEPANHEYIIAFTRRLVESQEKEQYVVQNLSRFRRDVWYWVLTHLLVERGSIFNTESFTKHSIHQMANSYQLDYMSIIVMLKNSIAELNLSKGPKPLLISILEKLAAESGEAPIITNKMDVTEEIRLGEFKQREANDFLENFLKSSRGGPVSELVAMPEFESFFLKLSAENRLLLLAGMQNEGNELSKQILRFFQENKTQLSSRNKWKTALGVLQGSDRQLVKRVNQVYKDLLQQDEALALIEQLLGQFNELNIASFYEASTSEKFISKLSLTFYKHDKKLFANCFGNRIIQLIRAGNWRDLATLKRLSALWIEVDAHQFLTFLQCSDHRSEAKRIIQEVSPHHWSDLLEIQPEPVNQLITQLKIILESLGGKAEKFAKQELLAIALEISLYSQDVRFIWTHLKQEVESRWQQTDLDAKSKFDQSIPAFLAARGIHSVSISETTTFLDSLSGKAYSKIKESDKVRLEWTISLAAKLSGVDKEKLYNYLLPGAKQKFEAYIGKHVTALKKEKKTFVKSSLEKTVERLFFSCLQSYDKYNGSFTKFEKLLKEAIDVHFESHEQGKLRARRGFEKRKEGLSKKLLQCLAERKSSVLFTGQPVSLRELVIENLEVSAASVREIIASNRLKKSSFDLLQQQVDYPSFVALLYTDQGGGQLKTMREVVSFIAFVNRLVPTDFFRKEESVFWEKTLEAVRENTVNKTLLEDLVDHVFMRLSSSFPHVDSHFINDKVVKHSLSLSSSLKTLLSKYKIKVNVKPSKEKKGDQLRPSNNDELVQLVGTYLEKGKMPGWFLEANSFTETAALEYLISHAPIAFVAGLRAHQTSGHGNGHLIREVRIDYLVRTLTVLYPSSKSNIDGVYQIFLLLRKSHSLSLGSLHDHFTTILLRSWVGGKWDNLDPSAFWRGLTSELLLGGAHSLGTQFEEIKKVSALLPTRFRLAFERFSSVRMGKSNSAPKQNEPIKLKRKKDTKAAEMKLPKSGIFVANAGLVLLNGFFKTLFERLKILDGGEFASENDKMQAAHYLQHVAIGHAQSAEPDLALNKILTGIPIEAPIVDGMPVTDDEVEIIEGMLNAAIEHWSALGKSSIHGFRGNWFVREGLLFEKEDYWNLVVEKRSYDILLNQSPFSFSIIKFPWMPKALKVEWPY